MPTPLLSGAFDVDPSIARTVEDVFRHWHGIGASGCEQLDQVNVPLRDVRRFVRRVPRLHGRLSLRDHLIDARVLERLAALLPFGEPPIEVLACELALVNDRDRAESHRLHGGRVVGEGDRAVPRAGRLRIDPVHGARVTRGIAKVAFREITRGGGRLEVERGEVQLIGPLDRCERDGQVLDR